MATLYTHKDKNIQKTWFLMAGFLAFVILVAWGFSQIYGNPGILYFGVIFAVVTNVLSYWYSDKLVLAMSHARPIEFKDNPELYRIVENLCITAGLPLPKIYIINEMSPNAFATGRNPEHAVIAVTKGLLERLNRTELEGVLAHELSHIGNRDMLVSTVAVVLVGFIALMSDWFLRISFWSGGRRSERRENGGGQGQAILMIAGIILAILAPIIASLMRLAISRKREFLADASGALLTRYPEGLAAALEKISADPTPLTVANNATAHLFIDDPLKKEGRTHWFAKLFMTHPPIEDRIRALRSLNF